MKLTGSLFHITQLTTEGTLQRGTLELDADHPIYQGHFPSNPITPGACQVQLVQELTEQHLGRHIEVKAIKGVKYLAMILPDHGTVEWEANIADGVAKYLFSQEGKPASKIDIRYE